MFPSRSATGDVANGIGTEGTSGGLPVAARQCRWPEGASRKANAAVAQEIPEGCACRAGANAPAGGRQAHPGTLWRTGEVKGSPPSILGLSSRSELERTMQTGIFD
jgi:hypothetical protein